MTCIHQWIVYKSAYIYVVYMHRLAKHSFVSVGECARERPLWLCVCVRLCNFVFMPKISLPSCHSMDSMTSNLTWRDATIFVFVPLTVYMAHRPRTAALRWPFFLFYSGIILYGFHLNK